MPSPMVAYAQEPCTITNTKVYSFPTLPVDDWYEADAPADFITESNGYLCEPDCNFERGTCGLTDNDITIDQNICASHQCYCAVKLDAEDLYSQLQITGTATITQVRWSQNDTTGSILTYIVFEWDDNTYTSYLAEQYNGWSSFDGYEMTTGKTLRAVYLAGFKALSGGILAMGSPQLWLEVCGGVSGTTCPTVADFHFTGVPTDTWTLDGSASILSSTLTLNPTGSASQTLSTTLQISTTYNAVISVTNAISAPVVVELGGLSQTITIDAPGLYTATFTATETISNPGYLLRNEGESEHYTDVDWTCVYQGGVITSTITCIAPLNGEFTTADNWDWYRSAAWNSPDENAFLPFNQGGDDNRALIVNTAVYSLPTLNAGQYLLMQFNASAGSGQEAIVASRVLSAWHEFNISGGEVYTYEHDISSMSGQSVTVAFANAGDDGSAGATECEFPAQDSVVLDNVCIYVADRPATDPPPPSGGFCPADLGFDWGCADVVPLLLGYGINVQGLDDVYATGVSVWNVENYIPWLVAALWHNVGHPVSCFIVEFMRLAVGLVEHQVNVFANYVNWVYTGAYSSPTWLQTGFFYLARYAYNTAIGQTPGGWLVWFGNSFRVVFYNLGLNQAYTIRDINGHLRDVQNPFYAASNTFVNGFEGALNQIMAEFIGMWNISILPYFTASAGSGSEAIPTTDPSVPESPWKPVFDMFLWLIQFVGQIVSTLWQLFRWLVSFLTTGTTAPIDAYHSFRAGMADEAYVLDVACVDDNWWCVFWGGVALINATTAQSIFYPIVITGIVCLTLVIVFKNLYEMFHIDIS